ncbi:MAG: thiamine-phosphate kinase [Candidatus Heimdallarchaeota archaeon]|nr:thiamine-phosphate kinase [Candidatus Heimdallarchaeota archaeon]MDH5644621.1 thiamine-phosphate kinase [Candidatus Heimdallarchaeota archaeon]
MRNNESTIIEFIQSKLRKSSDTLLPHPEDAVGISIGGNNLVINIDGWVESTDRLPGMNLEACGYRAVINAASDIVAKGAVPQWMLVSLSIPEHIVDHHEEIINGIVKASENYNIQYLGGDINSATDIIIDVVVLGIAKNLIQRSTARVNQKVYWLGPELGINSASIQILLNKIRGNKTIALNVVSLPYLNMTFLDISAKSSIDCSDGLAISLSHLMKSSKVGFEIYDFKNQNINKWVEQVASDNNIEISDLIFYGGEELGIIFTLDENDPTPLNAIEIGRVIEEKNIMYRGKIIEPKGWQHFQ